jgi:hypothetical protein
MINLDGYDRFRLYAVDEREHTDFIGEYCIRKASMLHDFDILKYEKSYRGRYTLNVYVRG